MPRPQTLILIAVAILYAGAAASILLYGDDLAPLLLYFTIWPLGLAINYGSDAALIAFAVNTHNPTSQEYALLNLLTGILFVVLGAFWMWLLSRLVCKSFSPEQSSTARRKLSFAWYVPPLLTLPLIYRYLSAQVGSQLAAFWSVEFAMILVAISVQIGRRLRRGATVA